MTLRLRLLILVALTIGVTVGLVTWIVSVTTRRAFESQDDQRTAASITQFRREFQQRGEEVVRKITGIAESDSALRMAIDLSRAERDFSPYVGEAAGLAAAHGLHFLELISNDGLIVSSAQWPAHFGYRTDWPAQTVDWNSQGFFLKREELPDGFALALVAVRAVNAGEKRLYIVGGYELGREFLASMVLPPGMRALLYRDFAPRFAGSALIGVSGVAPDADMLQSLLEQVMSTGVEASQTISWRDGPETIHAMPLIGREGNRLGALLVGSSRRELARLIGSIRVIGLVAATIGILLGVASSYWISMRVTRPVEKLVQGARKVAAGNWDALVDVRSKDEIGELAGAFNTMTRQLVDQRDRLIQAERVAAWRELARRLAHELKNPLFPLQITIENLQRAREQAPEQFDEVFRESTATLLMQLSSLKAITARFSDFARMPRPQLEKVNLNEIARGTIKLFDAQLHMPGRPPIRAEVCLDEDLPSIEADPEQIKRVLQNLLLNAIDAMPSGGTVTIRTRQEDGTVLLEVADSGGGLTKEECERLFTPYYTTKQHGTGLGLAIVQSVVSDHGAKISVGSEPGRGTAFRITFAGR